MNRLRAAALGLASLLWIAAASAADPVSAPTAAPQLATADSLTEAAFEAFRAGDASEDGWSEIYARGASQAEAAIALDAKHAEAHYALFLNLGRRAERSGIVFQMARIRRLRQLIERTLELDPEHAHAWAAYGEMLLRLPRWFGGSEADALQALEKAAALKPAWAKPLLMLAEHHLAEDNPLRAREFAEAGLARATAGEDTAAERRARRVLKKLPTD